MEVQQSSMKRAETEKDCYRLGNSLIMLAVSGFKISNSFEELIGKSKSYVLKGQLHILMVWLYS